MRQSKVKESKIYNNNPPNPPQGGKDKKQKNKKTEKSENFPFTIFWNLYPKKMARKKAETAWKNLSQADRSNAIIGIKKYLNYWQKTEKTLQFIPMPASWIHGRRWEDNLQNESENLRKITAKKQRIEAEKQRKSADEKRQSEAEKERAKNFEFFESLDPEQQAEIELQASKNIPEFITPDKIGYTTMLGAQIQNITAKMRQSVPV